MVTNKSGIYKILNIITRDYYLGSACNIARRFYEHRRELIRNIHDSCHLQNAWNKYGEQAFELSVVLLCDIENLLYYEDVLLKGLKPAYNIATDAFAPMQGRQHTEESRRTMSEKQRGELNPMFGMHRHHSEETKSKMGKAQKGELNHFFGKHHAEETKRKMRGRYLSGEAKQKISGENNHSFGKHLSEEHKLKLSESVTRYWAEKKKISVYILRDSLPLPT